jgi:gamma-glutamyltranspeptidase / glutathione hydrolase
VTPGTPGGLMTMLAEFGTLTLADVLAPSIRLADGYPIEAQTANAIESQKAQIKQWKYSPAVFLVHAGEAREAPSIPARSSASRISPRRCASSWRRRRGAAAGRRSRKEAIYAAQERFYRATSPRRSCAGARGGRPVHPRRSRELGR